MTAEFEPAPPAGSVDWVYVGRVVGWLSGPISRYPSRAELDAALAQGASIIRLQNLFRRSHDWVRPRGSR